MKIEKIKPPRIVWEEPPPIRDKLQCIYAVEQMRIGQVAHFAVRSKKDVNRIKTNVRDRAKKYDVKIGCQTSEDGKEVLVWREWVGPEK